MDLTIIQGEKVIVKKIIPEKTLDTELDKYDGQILICVTVYPVKKVTLGAYRDDKSEIIRKAVVKLQ